MDEKAWVVDQVICFAEYEKSGEKGIDKGSEKSLSSHGEKVTQRITEYERSYPHPPYQSPIFFQNSERLCESLPTSY